MWFLDGEFDVTGLLTGLRIKRFKSRQVNVMVVISKLSNVFLGFDFVIWATLVHKITLIN